MVFLFYKSWWGAILIFVFGPIVSRQERKRAEEVYQNQLRSEFKEALLMISTALQAGYSVENAFREAEKDLRTMTEGQSVFLGELKKINGQVILNVPLEKAFGEFAQRSRLQEAESFAEIFRFAKRAGGDYGENIRKTAIRMQQNIEVEEEIQTMITAKQLEMKIMSLMPVGILLYIQITSPAFLDGLYHNLAGIIVMTFALFLYGLAIYIGNRLVHIKV